MWGHGTCTLRGTPLAPWLRAGRSLVYEQNRLIAIDGSSYEYDQDGRWRRRVSGTSTTEVSRDAAGRAVRIEHKYSDRTTIEERTYDADGNLAVVREYRADGKGPIHRTRYTRERTKAGTILTTVEESVLENGERKKSTKVTELDGEGRVLLERDETGRCIAGRYAWDERGRCIRQQTWLDCGQSVNFDAELEYGEPLHEARGIDRRGTRGVVQVSYEVDARGNLVRIRKVDQAGKVVGDTQFEYEGEFRNFSCFETGASDPGTPKTGCHIY